MSLKTPAKMKKNRRVFVNSKRTLKKPADNLNDTEQAVGLLSVIVPATREVRGEVLSYMRMIYSIRLHSIVMTKGNKFKNGDHRSPRRSRKLIDIISCGLWCCCFLGQLFR